MLIYLKEQTPINKIALRYQSRQFKQNKFFSSSRCEIVLTDYHIHTGHKMNNFEAAPKAMTHTPTPIKIVHRKMDGKEKEKGKHM
uniref:Uncharacterized protein n=1 Tax=Arundo donax TaxID=35708 RepID=A0A0A9HLZ6_ARUDO